MEHRRRASPLDEPEEHEEADSEEDRAVDLWIGPAHRPMSVRLDPIGDPSDEEHDAGDECDVPRPVDGRVATSAELSECEISEDRGEEPDGDRDQEDVAPVDRSEDATKDQADEGSGEGRRLVKIAPEFARSMAAPTPWPSRMVISQIAAACPDIQVTVSRSEKTV